ASRQPIAYPRGDERMARHASDDDRLADAEVVARAERREIVLVDQRERLGIRHVRVEVAEVADRAADVPSRRMLEADRQASRMPRYLGHPAAVEGASVELRRRVIVGQLDERVRGGPLRRRI